MEYKSVVELQKAIQSGEVDINKIAAFNCKRELFIHDENGKRVFSAYYGTNNGCNDVCALLGLPEPEEV